jgi:hypothetical protein
METKFKATTDPKKKDGDQDVSKPGKPGNDPDQTPNKEVKNPPQADPAKQNQPDKQNNPPSSFRSTFANFLML